MSNLVPFNAGLGGLSQSREMRDLARTQTRALGQVEIGARVAAMHEQYKAEIAHQMLTNIGALSSLEQALVQSVPAGAARYAAIVNAYTASATAALMRF